MIGAVLLALCLQWRYATVPFLGWSQCGGWHQSHKQIIITQAGLHSDALGRELGEHIVNFILIHFDDLRHFKVSRLGTMPPSLPFTRHGTALGTQSASTKFLLRNSPALVFLKPYILALWPGQHSANFPIFPPLLGRIHTERSHERFYSVVCWHQVWEEQNTMVAIYPNARWWPSRPDIVTWGLLHIWNEFVLGCVWCFLCEGSSIFRKWEIFNLIRRNYSSLRSPLLCCHTKHVQMISESPWLLWLLKSGLGLLFFRSQRKPPSEVRSEQKPLPAQ